MVVKTLYVILAVVIIVIIGVVVFIKTEKYSSCPISFQIIQKNDPLQGIVYNYINLPAGNDIYTVMVDTGSPNLVITGFDTTLGTPLTTDQYDSYTIYGGNAGTAQTCINAAQTGSQLASECVVEKYYDTNEISITQPVTVFAGIYGSTPSIMGLAMPGLTAQGSSTFVLSPTTSGQIINIKPLVNWNTGSIQNFTVDFKNNILTFNDTDNNFNFYPRVRFYGYPTDFYALNCQTQELGNVNVVFDTGEYDCAIPANINTPIKNGTGTLTITSPFNAVINSMSSTYQSIPENLNFIVMGYIHMQTIGKLYFGANSIGIGH